MPIEDLIHPLVGDYTRSPQWVKSLLGGAYARLPISVRYGRAYPRFLEETQLQDPDEIAARVAAKLATTLDWAARTVPAYAAMRDTRPADGDPFTWLRSFPVLSKQDLKQQAARYLSSAMPASSHLYAYTGGSTSVPMKLYLEKHVSRPKDFAYNGAFDRMTGIGPHDVILALRGRTVPSADRARGRIWMYDPIKRYLHLSSDHLEPQHMDRYVEALAHFKPTFIHAFPSALYPLAWWLKTYPRPDIAARVRGIQLFSETVYAHQVALMREVFDCPVLFDYGHSERAVKAVSLPDDPRYFFWPLYGYVELVDFDGHPTQQPGVLGEIVATGFDNRVMPLIRYRTGDLGMWSSTPNTRRPGSPAMERIDGRLQEFLVCYDHRLVSITTIGVAHFAELAGADLMRFEQSVPGEVVLKVATRTPLSENAKRALAEGIRAKTQDGLFVTIEVVDHIDRTRSGKHCLLRQRLDVSSFLGAIGQHGDDAVSHAA